MISTTVLSDTPGPGEVCPAYLAGTCTEGPDDCRCYHPRAADEVDEVDYAMPPSESYWPSLYAPTCYPPFSPVSPFYLNQFMTPQPFVPLEDHAAAVQEAKVLTIDTCASYCKTPHIILNGNSLTPRAPSFQPDHTQEEAECSPSTPELIKDGGAFDVRIISRPVSTPPCFSPVAPEKTDVVRVCQCCPCPPVVAC